MSKILILANHYNSLRIFRRELIIRLVNMGNDVIIAIPPAEDEEIIQLESYGAKIIFTDCDRRGMNPIKDLFLLRRYKKLIDDIKPDKVLTYTIKPNIYGSIACKKNHVQNYCNITGLGSSFMSDNNFIRKIVSIMYKYSLNTAEIVFFENSGNRDILVNEGIVRPEQAVVLPGAGVNLSEFSFSEYPEDNGAVHFLYVGRIMKEKGVDELFYAIQRIKQEYPDTTFEFIGWYEGNYKEIVEKMQNENLIKYYGFQRDVIPYIRNSHCIVYPSYHEGMANTLLESCSIGRPIITSNVHGCMEAVVDGKNGYLVQVRDRESLYEKIKTFIELPCEKKKEMGLCARKHVEKYFDKNDVVDKTIEKVFL